MPWGLTRFHHSGQSHFVTFCCYHRRLLLISDTSHTGPLKPKSGLNGPPPPRVFELALERVRRAFRLRVYGYVVMPEHVHLLLSEPELHTLADALKSLKQGVARRLIDDAEHFWQKRYYDFNIRNHRQFVEKLRYIHRNPVKRGLCGVPEEWEWSSFRHYASGFEGLVEIESERTARKRERVAGTIFPVHELPHSSQKRA